MASYYKLNVAELPDELYDEKVPVQEWLKHITTADVKGFAPDTLNQLSPLNFEIEVERILGIALYMVGNVLPFLVTILGIAAFFVPLAKYALYFVLIYVGVMFAIHELFLKPRFMKLYNRPAHMSDTNIKDNQYLFTERNNTKYLSLKFAWPASLHRPKMEEKPVIFCVVPHGVAPFGITAYPMWSKLWNDKVCHWTCAPIVLKLPIVGYYMKQIGYVEAKAKNIVNVLTKKQDNIGIVLDGIDGMFQTPGGKTEVAYLKKRKGIVKIALRAGAPLVPVYGFGHTSLYTVLVDPFGILHWLSHTMQAALTPFFGRFGWFLGPPYRTPVTVCLGEPVQCPQIDEPTQEQVDRYHQKLLDSYQELFDKHKIAYGWGHKSLKFV